MKAKLQLSGDVIDTSTYGISAVREMMAWGWFQAVSVESVMAQVQDLTKGRTFADADIDELDVTICSNGGDLDVGYQLFHLFKSMIDDGIKINMHASGLVASAATLPLYANGKPKMPIGSSVLLHNPWCSASGDAKQMGKVSDMLQEAQDEMALFYSENIGISIEAANEIMKDNKKLTSTVAIEKGLADSQEVKLKIAASANQTLDYKSFLSLKADSDKAVSQLSDNINKLNESL